MATPRPSWPVSGQGFIQIGIVKIDVQLVKAYSSDEESPFVTVHAVDNGRIKTIKRCATCATDVDSAACSQAVEVKLDNRGMVLITEHDTAALATESRHTIVIDQCPAAGMVSPEYFESAYYVQPGGDCDMAAYFLLRRALESTGRCAQGKIAFRSKERIVQIAVSDSGQMMAYTLRLPAEMRDLADLPYAGPIPTASIEMMETLFAALNKKAGIASNDKPNLARYADDYGDKLKALLDLKRGARSTASAAASLEETLKKSVARAKRQSKVWEAAA